jgi:hypothetical protein
MTLRPASLHYYRVKNRHEMVPYVPGRVLTHGGRHGRDGCACAVAYRTTVVAVVLAAVTATAIITITTATPRRRPIIINRFASPPIVLFAASSSLSNDQVYYCCSDIWQKWRPRYYTEVPLFEHCCREIRHQISHGWKKHSIYA